MPQRWLALAGVSALALTGAGCGTLVNVTTKAPPVMCEGQRRIYGGVLWDLQGELRALSSPEPRYKLGFHLPMVLFYLIDLPLSAIGDTVTLPITVGEALGLSLPPWPPPPPVPPGRLPPAAQPPAPVGELPPPQVVE